MANVTADELIKEFEDWLDTHKELLILRSKIKDRVVALRIQLTDIATDDALDVIASNNDPDY